MARADKISKSTKTALFIVFAVYLLCFVFVISVNAYAISRNRNITASVHKLLPQTITLQKADIEWLMNCRSVGGAAGYQAGYDDACDAIRIRLGVGGKFKTGPSTGGYAAFMQKQEQYLMTPKTSAGYYAINLSLRSFEIYYNGSFPVSATKKSNLTDIELRLYDK